MQFLEFWDYHIVNICRVWEIGLSHTDFSPGRGWSAGRARAGDKRRQTRRFTPLPTLKENPISGLKHVRFQIVVFVKYTTQIRSDCYNHLVPPSYWELIWADAHNGVDGKGKERPKEPKALSSCRTAFLQSADDGVEVWKPLNWSPPLTPPVTTNLLWVNAPSMRFCFCHFLLRSLPIRQPASQHCDKFQTANCITPTQKTDT